MDALTSAMAFEIIPTVLSIAMSVGMIPSLHPEPVTIWGPFRDVLGRLMCLGGSGSGQMSPPNYGWSEGQKLTSLLVQIATAPS